MPPVAGNPVPQYLFHVPFSLGGPVSEGYFPLR